MINRDSNCYAAHRHRQASRGLERSTALAGRRAALLALSLLAALAISGCKDGGAKAASYTVRGELKSLPTEGQSAGMSIHHEAIPEFVNLKGERSGMASMSMPFNVADGVKLDGLAVGDKVEFTFDVQWERNPAIQVTAIKKLPPDTALTLTGM